ncbi:hypothetical protein HID58_009778, partial [Brassica napus]
KNLVFESSRSKGDSAANQIYQFGN